MEKYTKNTSNKMIPKIIHRLAPKRKKEWHPVWFKCEPSWYEHFPENEYEYIYWDDDKIETLIEEKFENLYNVFKAFPHDIMRLDFARYCILYEYGGIYVDMDYYCYKNFYDDLKADFSIVEDPSPTMEVQNSLMSSIKESAFLKKLIDLCVKNYNKYEIIHDKYHKNYSFYIHSTCGSSTIFNLIEELPKKERKKIQILSSEEYNPSILSWNKLETSNLKCRHFLTGHWGKENHMHHHQKSNIMSMDYQEYLKMNYKEIRNIDLDTVFS